MTEEAPEEAPETSKEAYAEFEREDEAQRAALLEDDPAQGTDTVTGTEETTQS